MNEKEKKIDAKIIDNPNEILKYLTIGTNIPILDEFHTYILGDLRSYNAKAIILKKSKSKIISKNVILGIVLVYNDGSSTLFFGFFGVNNDDPDLIELLVNKLVEYAKHNNYECIRGPINIPTIIFGWGFMAEASNTYKFIGCPVNPPNYQNIFIKKGFFIKFKEERYYISALKFDPHKSKFLKSKGVDFLDYEFINPGKEGMLQLKDEYLKMHIDNLPPSARITPKSSRNFDNIVDFIFKFGKEWMMWIVNYKPTKKIIACGYVLPNIFHKNKNGYMDSISYHDWVVIPEYRRKYITMLMWGEVSLRAMNRKTNNFIKWGLWPVGADNIVSIKGAEKMGGVKDRTHLILEYTL